MVHPFRVLGKNRQAGKDWRTDGRESDFHEEGSFVSGEARTPVRISVPAHDKKETFEKKLGISDSFLTESLREGGLDLGKVDRENDAGLLSVHCSGKAQV